MVHQKAKFTVEERDPLGGAVKMSRFSQKSALCSQGAGLNEWTGASVSGAWPRPGAVV